MRNGGSAFIEGFILPLLAFLLAQTLAPNPMEFDMQQRVSGGITIFVAACFIARAADKLKSGRA